MKKPDEIISLNDMEMKCLNELDFVDSFEIMDIEEKLDFAIYAGGDCTVNTVAGCGVPAP